MASAALCVIYGTPLNFVHCLRFHTGFGPSGEGYFRLTAFGSRENTIEAMERIRNMKK